MNIKTTEHAGFIRAILALSFVLAFLSIFMPGCIYSPVSWSPDSSKIALVVYPSDDDVKVAAIFTYDVTTGDRNLIDKVPEKGFLSAPSWSPDGKCVAYYKIDPPVEEQQQSDYTSEEVKTEDCDYLNVKLIIASPDGNDHKILKIVDWAEDDAGEHMMLNSPVWSPDSSNIFYVRYLSDEPEFEVCSFNLVTGQTQTYFTSVRGTPALSPDGKWIALLNEDDQGGYSFGLAGTGENYGQYFELIAGEGDKALVSDYEINGDEISLKVNDIEEAKILWSPDSEKILLQTEKIIFSIDIFTADKEYYASAYGNETGCPLLSLSDNSIYYLSKECFSEDDPNCTQEAVYIRRMNLYSGLSEILVNLSEFVELKDPGDFSISPDAESLLLRCTIKSNGGNEKDAILIFRDESVQIIETGPWLTEL